MTVQTRNEISHEWHPTLNAASIEEATTKALAWWLGECGHQWQASLSNRLRGSGCPVCAGKTILVGFNDLASTTPQIAAQWHSTKNELSPEEVTKSSNKKVWWQCVEGHEWEAKVNARTSNRSGCPYCSGKYVLKGFNDLASRYPELASQWHSSRNPITPQEVTPKSAKKVWWQCAENHEWQALIYSRVEGNGCPVCSKRIIQQGVNDLATSHPHLIAEWSDSNILKPHEVTSGSIEIVSWVCPAGHEWQSPIVKRANGTKCTYCYGRSVLPGFNDLTSKHPEVMEFWDYEKNTIEPNRISAYSHSFAYWKCHKGHQWQAPVYSLSGGSRCPNCVVPTFVSAPEQEIADILNGLGFQVRRNVRGIIGNLELDVFLPERNFAVEFNGLYWHSEANGKDKNYHLRKTLACKERDIFLYQIWEDDWRDRKEIVLRGLLHRLGCAMALTQVLSNIDATWQERVQARKCSVHIVDSEHARSFLDANHIQGYVPGTKHYGLKDVTGSIRALLTVTKRGEAWYIDRYATSSIVAGGFTKLFVAARKDNPTAKEWVTFADQSISDGGLYEQHGFIVDKILPPDYSYLVGGKRVHKFNYRLKRFRDDPALIFEEGLTETELAALNNLPRIWDSGKTRYVFNTTS